MKLKEMKEKQLRKVIQEAKKELTTRKKLAESRKRKLKETLIHDSDEYSIIELETARQAQRHSKGTNWSLREPRMFDRYHSEGPIYVIKDHITGEKFGVHRATDTYIDAYAQPVDFSMLRKQYPAVGTLVESRKRTKKRKG